MKTSTFGEPIVLSANRAKPDLSGLPHESLEDALRRGVEIKRIPTMEHEPLTRMARPTHASTNYRNNIYDWRV